jgi:tRNA (guanine-N7-)-methyltransferase
MTKEPPRSYAHAPRLPEGAEIDPGALLGAGDAPVELEIGPGRGGFMLERLAAEPALFMLGFEIRTKWATVVDERLRRHGFGARARVFAEDARVALPRLRPASLRAVFVHFPDPWWKKRHQKRLLLTFDLVSALARVLCPNGELFVQTDVAERALAYENVVLEHAGFTPWAVTARVSDNPYQAKSPRERRAVADGLPVFRLRFRRLGPGPQQPT